MNPDIGSRLGNYRLLQLLGVGGFARVYLGEHIYLQRLAAIKILHFASALSSEQSQAFLTEARTVARLEHPHIVHILEFGVERDWPYLIMDYAPNNLRSKHPEGTLLPLSVVVPYVSQVASALQYAHDNKVIHRDVKPENMLLDQNTEVLLSDFGIAKAIQNTTQTQDVAGTVHYMAPEQFMGRPIAASDQYALGIVVYQWLCGRFPFSGNNIAEICYMHLNMQPPSLCAQVPDLPVAVEQIVMTALAKDASQRFADIQEFAAALEYATRTPTVSTPLLSGSSLQSEESLPLLHPATNFIASPPISVELVQSFQDLPTGSAHQPETPPSVLGEATSKGSSPIPLLPSFAHHEDPTIVNIEHHSEDATPILRPPLFAQHKPPSAHTGGTPEDGPPVLLSPFSAQPLPAHASEPSENTCSTLQLPSFVAPIPDVVAQEAAPVPLPPLSTSFVPYLEEPQGKEVKDIHDGDVSSTPAAPDSMQQASESGVSILLPPASFLLEKMQLFSPSPEPEEVQPLEPTILLSQNAAVAEISQPIRYKFFISYDNADRKWANWLRWLLEDAGYSVLLPERKDLVPIDMMLEMQEAVTKAEYIIAVFSSRYIAAYSSQCQGLTALNGQGRVLPVRIEECEHNALMKFFSASSWIDLVDLDEQNISKRLLESARTLMKPPFPGPTFLTKNAFPLPSVKVFLSYSRKDKQQRKRLEKYLKSLEKQYPATSWHDGEIVPGEDFAQQIEKNLSSAHIILLLVSQDFIASDYCYDKEMMKAMKRHDANEACVIPIILRPSTWKDTPLGKLQALPTDGKPINTWDDKDEAFLDVSKGIKKAIVEMLNKLKKEVIDSNL